jgi:hypothetical protein
MYSPPQQIEVGRNIFWVVVVTPCEREGDAQALVEVK